MCSIPALVLAAFLAWLRWELPPLQRYYLLTYWDSSRHATSPASTTRIEWLYVTAPGRKNEIALPLNVAPRAGGSLPVDLSSSARKQGWDQLVKMPAQSWSSSELENFLQDDFYDGRTFSEITAEPLLFLLVIFCPLLCIAATFRQQIKGEWRLLYEELSGTDFALDSGAVRWRSNRLLEAPIDRPVDRAKGGLSRVHWTLWSQKLRAEYQTAKEGRSAAPSREDDPVASVPSPEKPTGYRIFPGTAANRDGNVPPKPWDKSQWID